VRRSSCLDVEVRRRVRKEGSSRILGGVNNGWRYVLEEWRGAGAVQVIDAI
jgi:hypothetical protein